MRREWQDGDPVVTTLAAPMLVSVPAEVAAEQGLQEDFAVDFFTGEDIREVLAEEKGRLTGYILLSF